MAAMTPADSAVSPAAGAVLVTGASGFIGRQVARRLAAAGYKVTGLTRKPALARAAAAGCARVISGDILDPAILDQALDGAAAVCHLAAYIPSDYGDPEEASTCLNVNALGTLEVARAALRHGIRRVVHASTASFYPPGIGPVSEETPIQPTGHAAWYQVSKAAAESYLERLGCSDALSPVILRIASCYGPGMAEAGVLARFVARARRGQTLEVGHGGRPQADFVHVRDVANCFAYAVSRGQAGIYNVGAGTGTTLLGLAHAVTAALGSSAPVRTAPPNGEPPAGQPALSIAKAAAAWGYAPMSLEAGLATFADSS